MSRKWHSRLYPGGDAMKAGNDNKLLLARLFDLKGEYFRLYLGQLDFPQSLAFWQRFVGGC